MTMKNLTHYFKSPKEDETDPKVKHNESPIELKLNEEKEPPKKRKISLSKSKKKKKSESHQEKILTTENSQGLYERQNEIEEPLIEISDKKSKKRKIDDNSNSSCKKIKPTNSSTISLKKCDNKNKVSSVVNVLKTQSESIDQLSKNITPETEDKVDIVLENSLSCDEPVVQTNRKAKKILILDSDEEVLPKRNQSPPSSGKVENIDSSCNLASRRSLFSYFTKVDKETALEQNKSRKIEVKAIIHSSLNGVNTGRQSVDKISHQRRVKKHKNKLQLDDSDTIEIISSEEILDENSSTTVNVPLEVEHNHKIASVPISENETTNLNKSSNKSSNSSNLASIFMPKKIGQQSKNIGNVSSLQAKSETPVKENEKVQCQKETKTKALSKSKNFSKKSKKLKKEKLLDSKQSVDDLTEDDSYFEVISKEGERQVLSDDKCSSLKLKGCVTNTSNLQKDCTEKYCSSPKSQGEKTLLIRENTKAVKTTKSPKNCDGKTPEKPNFLKSKSSNDEEVTPNKKVSTINGYFTTKSNTGSSQQCTKNIKSPWVMKVCLNNINSPKNLTAESDDDSFTEDSQDSTERVKKQLHLNSQEESCEKVKESEDNLAVVVIEDNDDSSTEVNEDDDNSKRRSLPRNVKKAKQRNVEEEEEEEIVEIKPLTTKPAVKMWPFFQKGGARQAKEAPVDEAKLKAKMLFLESGVPEIIKRKVETVKSETVLGLPAPFPTVSHVIQAEQKNSCGGIDSASLSLPPARRVLPPPAVPTWESWLPLDSPEEVEIHVFDRPGNVKAFLEKLKEEEPKTEIKVLFKKLKEYKSKAESDIWTEVYKPTNSADMVGNSESIKKLKTWLETLKNCRKREGSVSSGDEFVNGDSDGEDNSFNNMAVICGPCGCGKTSAVYAIAKELDIKVLEINASCNRSGKRILAEFSESTQSHHVERSQPINGFFNNQSSGRKKRKKSKVSEKLKSEKTSLILVEDADLLFTDCDEGFVPALASLAASSKRPIVLVTNQTNTPHLDRFNNSKLLRLTFNRPRPNKLGLWLRLVGLVEGVMMPSDLASRLVTVSNCDVRRCLLQLQLMVHSNNSEVKDKLNPSRLWWGWPTQLQLSYELPTLLEPEEEQPSPEVDKKLVISQLQSVAHTTRRLANLDVLSLDNRLECLEEHEDPCPVAWATRWRDSTDLTVPTTCDLGHGPEAAWLQRALANSHDHGATPSHRTGQTPQEARWLSILRQGEQMYMSGIATTAHTNHQAVTCDYLPTLRELGRSEQVRLANYTRRANRFFNYLQGLGIHASKSYRDFMCDAFS